jgi:hypothetical protein
VPCESERIQGNQVKPQIESAAITLGLLTFLYLAKKSYTDDLFTNPLLNCIQITQIIVGTTPLSNAPTGHDYGYKVTYPDDPTQPESPMNQHAEKIEFAGIGPFASGNTTNKSLRKPNQKKSAGILKTSNHNRRILSQSS